MREEKRGVVGVFGATGFIGRRLMAGLRRDGWETVGFSRRLPPGEDAWRSSAGDLDLGGLDGVVNLAGESVAQRWTAAVRERCRDSRVGLTERIVDSLAGMPVPIRPGWLINASAVGYYGPRGDEILTEEEGAGTDYLAELCRDWEAATEGATELGLRVVRLRIGIVLGPGGDAWTRLSRVFRLGIGGTLGNGRQWMPWIHVDDVVGAILLAIGRDDLSGPLNLGAPEPVRNAEFTKALAKQLRRPAVFRVPGIALKAALGGFGGTLVASYRMLPERLSNVGYEFRHPRLEEALADLDQAE